MMKLSPLVLSRPSSTNLQGPPVAASHRARISASSCSVSSSMAFFTIGMADSEPRLWGGALLCGCLVGASVQRGHVEQDVPGPRRFERPHLALDGTPHDLIAALEDEPPDPLPLPADHDRRGPAVIDFVIEQIAAL